MTVVDNVLTSVPTWVTYLAVFLLPFLEASVFLGFVVPGETALVLGGVLAAQGRAQISLLMVLGVTGAILGDAVGYAVGRRFGPALQRSRLGRVVGDQRWRTTEDFLRRRGGPAVFLGRFTALLRALVPSAAGMAGLPYKTFALWNAIGGGLWAVSFVFVGFIAGESYKKVEQYLGRGALVLTAVLVVGLFVAHRVRRGRHEGAAKQSS